MERYPNRKRTDILDIQNPLNYFFKWILSTVEEAAAKNISNH